MKIKALLDYIFDLIKPELLISTFFFISYIFFIHTTSVFSSTKPEYAYKSDFRAYQSSSQLIKEGKVKSIYDINEQYKMQIRQTGYTGIRLAFLNTPLSAFIFLPLASFDYITAYKILIYINLLILALITFRLKSQFNIDNIKLAPIIFFIPVFAVISYGQITFLLLFFLIEIYIAIKNGDYTKAGFISGLLAIKPQYLVIIPLLLAITNHKFLKGFVLSITFFLVLNFLIFGGNFIPSYLSFLLSRSESLVFQEHLSSYNLFGLRRFNSSVEVYYLITLVSLVLYLLVLRNLYKLRGKVGLLALFSAIILFSVSINYHNHVSDLVLLIIPIIFLLKNLNPLSIFLLIVLFLVPFLSLVDFIFLGGLMLLVVGFVFLLKSQAFVVGDPG